MGERNISIDLDRSAKPSHCRFVGVTLQLGKADVYRPCSDAPIARTESQCFLDMSFRFFTLTDAIFSQTDLCVSASEVPV